MPVGESLAQMLASPALDHVGDLRGLRAEDEPEPGPLDVLLVLLGHRACVRDDRDVVEPVRGHERFQCRQHRRLLGFVALERLDPQRKTARVGEQPDRDLRLEAPFLAEPRLAEPVALMDLVVARGHVVEDQRRRPQLRIRYQHPGENVPEGVCREHRQAPLDRRVRRRRDTGLVENARGVGLAGRLDDPRQHQLPEHLVRTDRPAQTKTDAREPHTSPARLQREPHRTRTSLDRVRREAEVQLWLGARDLLPPGGLQRRDVLGRVRGTKVLDDPANTTLLLHDLHHGRSR